MWKTSPFAKIVPTQWRTIAPIVLQIQEAAEQSKPKGKWIKMFFFLLISGY